jgi:GNAT superfamily N-acetyltransferase
VLASWKSWECISENQEEQINKGNMMKKARYNIAVEYQSRSELGMPDPDGYLFNINIKVVATRDAGSHHEVVLGEGLATRVRVGHAIYASEDLHEVFDCDQGLLNAGNVLFEASFQNYKPAVLNQFPDNYPDADLLLVRSISLRPEYRGQKIGLAAMHRMLLDLAGDCGLVMLKPYPLGSGKVMPGRDKLRRYWARLGFKRLAGSAFWAVSGNSPLPSESELGLPTSVLVSASPKES